jgi:hypothetical protein
MFTRGGDLRLRFESAESLSDAKSFGLYAVAPAGVVSPGL